MSKFWAIFKLVWIERMVYRLNFFMDVLSGILSSLIVVFLWIAIYKSAGGGAIGGYAIEEMVTYILGGGLINSFILTTAENPETSQSIQDGNLSFLLIKPLSPYGVWLARDLGSKAFLSKISWGLRAWARRWKRLRGSLRVRKPSNDIKWSSAASATGVSPWVSTIIGAGRLSFCFPFFQGLFVGLCEPGAFPSFSFFDHIGSPASIFSLWRFKPVFFLGGKHLRHSFYHAGHYGSGRRSHNPSFFFPPDFGKNIHVASLSIFNLYSYEDLSGHDPSGTSGPGIIQGGRVDSGAGNAKFDIVEKRDQTVRGDGRLSKERWGDSEKGRWGELNPWNSVISVVKKTKQI